MAGSCCLWYYSRRYVGEMAVMLPDAQRVRFSVLDFWGNREVREGQGVRRILMAAAAVPQPALLLAICTVCVVLFALPLFFVAV